MQYYIAINDYRSSTSEGFANTWSLYRCDDREHQNSLLTKGLPVSDVHYTDGSQCYSKNGIRTVTRDEYRYIKGCESYDGEYWRLLGEERYY